MAPRDRQAARRITLPAGIHNTRRLIQNGYILAVVAIRSCQTPIALLTVTLLGQSKPAFGSVRSAYALTDRPIFKTTPPKVQLSLSEVEASVLTEVASRIPTNVVTARDRTGTVASSALAAEIYRSRRDRRHFFPEDLFADPAWDMLLALYCSEERQELLTTTGLCLCADAPQTTALRWLTELERLGLIMRAPHPDDGRYSIPKFTEFGRAKIRAYLERISPRYFKLV